MVAKNRAAKYDGSQLYGQRELSPNGRSPHHSTNHATIVGCARRGTHPTRYVTSRNGSFDLLDLRLARTQRLASCRDVERLARLTCFPCRRDELNLLIAQIPRRTFQRHVTRVMPSEERSNERLADTLGMIRSREARCELIRSHVVTTFRLVRGHDVRIAHHVTHMRICTITRNDRIHNVT